jgi:putative membrane protein
MLSTPVQSASQKIFAEWSPPIALSVGLIFVVVIYFRGWLLIRSTRSSQFPAWRLLCFVAGISIVWLAIASPLDGFADALLSAHMIEHLLLMSFVPPLVLLGAPTVPLLRGMPAPITTYIIGPILQQVWLRRLGHWLITPLVAWFAMNLFFLGWHLPTAYDFALEHECWHEVEHLCFLVTSILFWWPLVRPWPTDDAKLGWFMLPYLVMADIVNTLLSAFLAFCDRPVYTYYIKQPNIFHITPLDDQRTGAVVMWVVGSLVFLVPAIVITIRLLQHESKARA